MKLTQTSPGSFQRHGLQCSRPAADYVYHPHGMLTRSWAVPRNPTSFKSFAASQLARMDSKCWHSGFYTCDRRVFHATCHESGECKYNE
jgi:hypothetical protein